MKYAVLSSKDHYYGGYETRGEAGARCLQLSKEYPGIKFYIYEQIYEYCTPTEAQRENDEFWRK